MGSLKKWVFWILLPTGVFHSAEVKSQSPGESIRLNTVVIDPGHGGYDPGVVSGNVKEKDLVLAVGLLLGEKIRNAYPDVNIVYTRSRDIFIPLHARASLATRHKADLFLSIHANGVSQSSVRGTETFTLGLHRSQENLEVAKKENSVILLEEDYTTNYEGFNPNETESYIMFENIQAEYQNQSIDLAARIQEELTRRVRLSNRGVKQAGFLVLRQTSMPSALVEIGFISNPAERNFLVSDNGKEQTAESLFQAFSKYKQAIDERSQFNLAIAGTEVVRSETNKLPGSRAETAKPVSAGSPAAGPGFVYSTSAEKDEAPSQPATDATRPMATESTPPAGKTKDSAGMATPPPEKPAGTPAGTSTPRIAPAQQPPNDNTTWYSVQIAASTSFIDPASAKFKGEKNIVHVRVDPYHKYFIGRYSSGREALNARQKLKPTFPDAFPVVFENNQPRPLKMEDLR